MTGQKTNKEKTTGSSCCCEELSQFKTEKGARSLRPCSHNAIFKSNWNISAVFQSFMCTTIAVVFSDTKGFWIQWKSLETPGIVSRETKNLRGIAQAVNSSTVLVGVNKQFSLSYSPFSKCWSNPAFCFCTIFYIPVIAFWRLKCLCARVSWTIKIRVPAVTCINLAYSKFIKHGFTVKAWLFHNQHQKISRDLSHVNTALNCMRCSSVQRDSHAD